MEKESVKKESVFKEFTNLYQLNKTLRFSLIPVLTKKQEQEILQEKKYKNESEIKRQDKVEKFFQNNKKKFFEADIERAKQYKKLKYYLTELHKLFLKDALKRLKKENKIDFSKLFAGYKEYEKINNEDKKEELIKKINEEKIELAKFFGNKNGRGGIFQKMAEQYYTFLKDRLKNGENILDNKNEKQKKNNILLSQNVLLILDKKIKDGLIEEKTKQDKNENEVIDKEFKLNFIDINGEGRNLIEYFQGWSTYFKNFNEIRGNLYKDDGRKEEIFGGERKIQKANSGQITTRILDENFEIFVRNSVWADENKKKLELDGFNKIDLENGESILSGNFYVHCLSQEDINTYNKKIGELNGYFNRKKQKKNKKLKINFLNTLYKQLILSDGLEDNFIPEFVDDKDFIRGLEDFGKHSTEKVNLVKNLITPQNLTDNLGKIFFDENQTHFWCNEFFGDWNFLRKTYYKRNKIDKKYQSEEEKELKNAEGVIKKEISFFEIQELLNGIKKDDFKNALKKGNFNGESDQEKIEYNEIKSNFENFVQFLNYYFDSLIKGRSLLTKREEKDLRNIKREKEKLKKSEENGVKIDKLLFQKFSENDFRQSVKDSLWEKERKFKKVLLEYKKSVANGRELNKEKDFQFKKTVNEYCNRVNDINNFFLLFFMPEGIEKEGINRTIKDFKENKIISFYNQIRNFITKKRVDKEKVKLNFDIKNLLGGWGYRTEDHPKSSDYKCRLFRKNGKFYVGIVGNPLKNILDQNYELMDYYQLKGKTIFGSVYSNLFGKAKYKEDKGILSNDKLIQRVEKIIDKKLIPMFPKVKRKLQKIKKLKKKGVFNFTIKKKSIANEFQNKTGVEYDKYKKADKRKILLKILQKDFNNVFNFELEKEYILNRIKELFGAEPKRKSFKGADKMVYEITKLEPYFYKIVFNSIKLGENNNIIALFEIYNKDFSIHKEERSKKNLHTLYFEELFTDKNIGNEVKNIPSNPIFKLSGGAEIFFREKVEDYKLERWGRNELKNPKTEKIPYKKRRFTQNQILFHLPIILNNINKGENLNKKVNHYIQNNNTVKILGIDRGEKELAYYCLLDGNGKIFGGIKSMNKVGSNIVVNKEGKKSKQKVNYQTKLGTKEIERMIARKAWTKIEGIKDLKKGYISNVVHDIARTMVNNESFVCLEELNYGFKRGRIKIEKSIYQQFENALVDKLGYLVLEKTSNGIRNARQLTPENRAQKYWGNQMGAIFYTDAKFTSKTCPNCGFRRRGVSDFDNGKNLREKIKNGDLKVFYESKKDRFRIEYNWQYEFTENSKKKNFNNQDLYGEEKMEVIYSDVKRSIWNKKTYNSSLINPNKELKKIFKGFYENIEGNKNIATEKNNFSYPDFIRIFHSILNIRNTIKGEDIISCPKCHFSTHSEKTAKIKNGDANGAYNIARKGLMIFEKIRSDTLRKKNQTKNGIRSIDLKVSLNEWDQESFRQWDGKDWEQSKNERRL